MSERNHYRLDCSNALEHWKSYRYSNLDFLVQKDENGGCVKRIQHMHVMVVC